VINHPLLSDCLRKSNILSDFFGNAIKIDGIQLTPLGYRARYLYALSRAQSRLPTGGEVSAKTLKEAIKLIPGKLTVKDDGDDWDAFDLLIKIVER
jgi:hypothetical protein